MKILPEIAPFTLRNHFACPAGRVGIRGATLVEALVVCAIAAVLLAAAAPGMTGIIDSIRLSSSTNLFASALHLARSEAIKTGDRVVLCKSEGGDACSSSNGWEQGWIVFLDADDNGQRDDGETILSRQGALPATIRLTGNLNVARYVSYSPVGVARLVGGGFQAGTLTLCKDSASGAEARQIILSATGSFRTQTTTADACG